jgi:hypothetical protein
MKLETVAPILGHAFVERMTGKKYAVLRIGNETFTRHQLVTEIGTGNFRAAALLSELCQRLDIKSVKDLINYSPYALAAEHGVGVTTLFVALSLLSTRGVNVRSWFYMKETKTEHQVSFETLKHRATKRDAAAEKDAKKTLKRKARRAGKVIHREKVKQFLETQIARHNGAA